ncbi:MAG: O-antigen ligase family protein [Clostridia bacterium]|nr:O-antigen ligase family protein [Clostridia bacterium]
MKKNSNFNILNLTMLDFSALLLIIAFFAIRDIPIFLYGTQAFFLINILLSKKDKKINIKFLLSWMVMIFWVVLSFLWATSTNNALKFLREIGQCAIVCILLSVYCKDKESIKKMLKFISIAMAIMIIYLFIKTPLSEWNKIYNYTDNVADDAGRLGYTIGVHPNSMGSLCVITFCIWLYIFKTEKNKFSFIWMFLSVALLLFSKSRGAILQLLVMFFLFWILEENDFIKNIKKIILIVVISVIAVYSILNVPFLYNLIGFRFEGILGIFNSNSTKVDASTTGRTKLMLVGLKMFLESPVLGVGAGNYANIAYYEYDIWKEVYSHCNYIEILANLGCVGFIIYYYPRIFCVLELLKKRKCLESDEKYEYVFLLSFCITNFFAEITKITYSNEPTQIIYTISFGMLCYLLKRKKDSSRRDNNEK